MTVMYTTKDKGKFKAVPLEAWIGPEGSRKLRFLDFATTAAFIPQEILPVLISIRG